MADIKKVINVLYKAEFSSPDDALEINETENGYTFMGIYQEENPDWAGWDIVNQMMKQYGDIKTVSRLLYQNEEMQECVADYYKKEYWDRARLDEVNSQKIANEIFIFGVNAGMSVGVKKAQEVVGVDNDGVIGKMTLKALNEFDENVFDFAYDEEEIEYYKAIVANKPQKARFLNGWINRAHLV